MKPVLFYLFNICLHRKFIQKQFGEIVLVLIIIKEAISACRFLKVEGSYMRVSTVDSMTSVKLKYLANVRVTHKPCHFTGAKEVQHAAIGSSANASN